jgi:pimeloyl-ACP methyl ester carboxylesterase
MTADIVPKSFRAGDVDIAFLDAGEGDPVVLIHGFASNKEANWLHPGWIATLVRDGRRVIALDNRGHGASTKLYDPALYDTALMAGDVRDLIDHLGLARADIMGYSMGARIAAFLALAHGERVRALIMGGLGIRLVEGVGLPESIAVGLEARSVDDLTDPQQRMFRIFADHTGSDRKALAACIRGTRQTISRAEAGRIAAPTLIAVGDKDAIAGSAQALAALIPGARAIDIPGRDHMLAVGDRVFKAAVLEFLARRP